MPTPNETDVLAGIAEVAAAELDRHHLPDLDAPLVTALELDSLRRLSLLVALEDRFRVVLPDDELEAVRTLRQLAALIAAQMSQPAEARP